MKNSLIIFGAFLLMLFACTKPEDEFFGGHGHYNGLITFEHVITGSIDTAKLAKITLTKTDTNIEYSRQLTDGTFNISDLQSGNYNLKITYELKVPQLGRSVLYSWTVKDVSISDNGSKSQSTIRIISDSSTYTGIALKLRVRDDKQGLIPNTKVFLYADPGLLAANRFSNGTGSIKSGTTDNNGYVVFDGLAAEVYYASAFIVYDKDTLSNRATDQTALIALKPNSISEQPVVVKAHPPVTPPTSLKVTVNDNFGANMVGVNVCLYSDPGLIQKYKDCTGSLRSGTTNGSGVISFDGLQQLQYYVAAYKPIGKDTLSNITTKQTPTGLLQVNKENQFQVIIK